MKTLLDAISPTAQALIDPDVHFYPCTYSWNHRLLGELRGSTVITGTDEEAALKSFRSKHPNLTGAWIVKD